VKTVRAVVLAAMAAAVFLFSWFLRFSDPNGSFAGLTDDHFFYLVRGWQILYGDLPVRDFVDHGAPLYYYVAAAVQLLFGRGTLSELAFSVTAVSLAAALTFWLAARASGSLLAGLAGAAVQIALTPRFYNYPKILVYTAAVPLLWWFADRPGRKPLFWLAVTTAVGGLLRLDHGAFVGASVALLLLMLSHLSWRQRAGYALFYAAVTIALLSPYLIFIQVYGGVDSYMEQAMSWAARERERTPIVWPGLFDYPDGMSDAAREGEPLARTVAVLRDNAEAWWYYVEIALPAFALGVLALARDAGRPGWGPATAKIAVVAALGLILDAGFLRSPLSARLADPSVPFAILIAWLLAVLLRLAWRRDAWRAGVERWRAPLTAAALLTGAAFAFVITGLSAATIARQVAIVGVLEGVRVPLRQAAHVADTVRQDWELKTWEARENRPELITLAMYLNACTPPNARIFVQPYVPAVLPMARRGFAGGHADLRPGFFTTESAQRLTIERLQRQDVPAALLETGQSLENFRRSFPLITAYLDENYSVAGTHVFDERFGITLLLHKRVRPTHSFADLSWPCAS